MMHFRALETKDMDIIQKWLTPEMLNKIDTGSPDESKPYFIVVIAAEDDSPVGLMEISSIDMDNKNARFGVMCIDARGYQYYTGWLRLFSIGRLNGMDCIRFIFECRLTTNMLSKSIK